MIENRHRFFEKNLDINIKNLREYIENKYIELKKENHGTTVPNDRPYDPGNHWRTFNIFNFSNSEIHSIYKNVRDITKEACSYYNIDFDKNQYYIHGWFNYWSGSVQRPENPEDLDYHDHGIYDGAFHGYYCLNAEPSITYYKIDGSIFENINKNNRMIVSKNGAPHAIGEWASKQPRITIAYNISPINFLDPSVSNYVPLS